MLPPTKLGKRLMKTFAHCRSFLAHLAILLVLVTSMPIGLAEAGLVPTEDVIVETFGPSEARARIDAFFDREDVQAQFAALGVEPAEAAARIAALSDDEVATIAGQLDQLPAGEGFLVTAAVVGGVILLILIITDIAGITNVFTFIR